jgi:putative ABC transport system permease protein
MSEGYRRLFRLPASRGTVARDVDEELAFHLERRTAELVSRGIPEAEARRQAEARFGDVVAARAELVGIDRVTLRRAQRADGWDATRHELRLALRGLGRTPGFTAAVVLMLALGIGVNATMFGITDRLLLSAPPHVHEPDEVVRVLYGSTPPFAEGVRRTSWTLPYADYVELRERVDAFGSMASYTLPQTSSLGRGAEATELRTMGVTAGWFELLGAVPAAGRFFAPEEALEPAGERVVVLSHRFWRSHFGAERDVPGRVIEIDHEPYTVIGVAPRGFHGIDLESIDAWIPLPVSAARLGEDWYRTRAMEWVRLVARLAPGASLAAAQAEASAVYLSAEDYQARYADDPTAGIVLGSVIAARAPSTGSVTGGVLVQRSGRIALWLFGVSAVVLLIACVNVSNLLLARGLRRQRETGVRMAIGGGRGRLAGQVLAESVLLAAAAVALALLLAHWGGHLARSLLAPHFEWTDSPVNGRVLAFATAAALACVLLAGLLPALHAARAEAVVLLRGGGRGATYRRSRLRSGLVVLQATLSVLLLVGAGLFVRSLHAAQSVPLGFEPERVALLEWHRANLGWPRERVFELYDRSLERVRALPEVEAAALSFNTPMYGAAGAGVLRSAADPVQAPPGMFGFMYNAVSPGWFATMGTRIERGRGFTDADVQGSAPVAVVTASFAEWVWPGEDALGRCFYHNRTDGDARCHEVIGITGDIRWRTVEGETDVMFYLPLAQAPSYPMRVLSVRTRGDVVASLPALRTALHELEPGLPHIKTLLLDDRVAPQLQPWRLGAVLFTGFGALALLLAGLGLYGVIAYDVGQRRRELGVRAALGALRRDVVRLVFDDAVRVGVAGLLLGLLVAAAVAPRLAPLLFGVGPHDAAVYATVALLLLGVAGLAALLPALRATRVQPVEALREE